MTRIASRLVVCACLLAGMLGCKSSHYSSFLPDNKIPYDGSAHIVGLPLLGNGVELTADCRNRMEMQIDQSLSKQWKARYVPIASLRQEHGLLADGWASQMACNYDLSVWLQGHTNLCRNIMQASGCRYAVVPTLGSCSCRKATSFTEFYIIPAGPVIVYGSLPVAFWEYPGGKNTFFTMVLVDLEQGVTAAEEAMGVKTDLDQATLPVPGAMMDGLKRMDLQLAKKSGAK